MDKEFKSGDRVRWDSQVRSEKSGGRGVHKPDALRRA